MGRADGGGRKGLGWAKRDGSTGEMSVRQCGGAAVWQRVVEGGVACRDIYICMYMYEYRQGGGTGVVGTGGGVGGRGAGGDWRNKWFDAGALQCVGGGGGMQ